MAKDDFKVTGYGVDLVKGKFFKHLVIKGSRGQFKVAVSDADFEKHVRPLLEAQKAQGKAIVQQHYEEQSRDRQN